ncbi:MAG TPA: shikimate dehydrogenase [Mycobacteriales bacterium]|nr:shikimate dehydrogenase [Mycobacteriales bacterium]
MRAAVLGSPIQHSLSPLLHRAAYRALGLDWAYDAVEITAPELAGYLEGLGAEWAGLSLTRPLKEVALPLMDEVTPLARQVAAVNTVVLQGGSRLGDNTDVHGLSAAIRALDIAPGGRAVVLGGGATARAALVALAERDCAAVAVLARTARPELAELAGQLGLAIDVSPLADAPIECDLLVSTLPPGVADSFAGLAAGARALLDVVYAPWPTALARACPGRVAGGALVLLHQAARQVTALTGRPAPLDAMRAALPTHVLPLAGG